MVFRPIRQGERVRALLEVPSDQISEHPEQLVTRLLNDYADVFPDELPPGLPPNRAFDHKITLEPGIKPVAKPTYKISPSKRNKDAYCRTLSPWLHTSVAQPLCRTGLVCGEEGYDQTENVLRLQNAE